MKNIEFTLEENALHWLGSTEEIGYEDLSDICTKRRVYWMRLSNNQLRQVADIRVIINPFPRKSDTHYCGHETNINSCDGLEYLPEKRLYAATVLEAGRYLGRMMERSGAREEKISQ